MTRANYTAQSRGWQPSSQELTDGGTDFGGMRFQREMPGVEKTHVGVANVATNFVAAATKICRPADAPARTD